MSTVEIIQGDCLEVMKNMADGGGVDCVITDPPYGINNNCDYTRFSGGSSESKSYYRGITNDNKPFDPRPFLKYKKVIIWGYQYFSQKLPIGTILVWKKKRDSQLGSVLSDCELAWQKGGKGVFLFNHVWNGFDRQTETGIKRVHPTQKPVALMEWCVKRISKEGDTVFDPFMGSGATGIACQRLGRNFIGIEIDPEYCEIARRRIKEDMPLFNKLLDQKPTQGIQKVFDADYAD